jgi:tRNA A-37 threonylcarbamoyl transferase component Bud32
MPAGAIRAARRSRKVRTGSAAEFVMRMRALGVIPQREDPWLVVGRPVRIASWKLHVSATVTGIDLLFKRVLPRLARHRAHFKIAAGRDAIVQLNAGNLGEAQIGKVITVYPRNDTEAVALAGELIEHTRGMVGPAIATDLHLGGAVYARYGSVRPRITHDRFGEPSELIPDGSGKWIADLRPVPFSCPHGIGVPFLTGTSAQPAEGFERRLLAGRYFVTDVLRPGLAGSVLRAIDLRNARGPKAYVLKQARPHCCADELGRDRRARLRHEGAMLGRLRGLEGIASAGQYFEDEDVGYLPVTYVPGQTLAALVYQSVAGRSWWSVRVQVRRRLLHYVAQLARRLRSAHARGVIHRDVAPSNVWIGDDDRVYLLDWECAHVVGSRIPAFRLGTRGFSDLSREQRAPAHRDDWQACGRVLAFVLTGLDPAAVVHGRPRALAARLAELTQLRDTKLTDLLARTLADRPAGELDAAALLSAIAATAHGSRARRQRTTAPLFTAAAHDSVLAEGLEMLTARFRLRLDRLRIRRAAHEAATIDAHAGIAGLLYVLAAAHTARVAHLDTTLAERAARVLTARTPVTPDLPGLVHGRAGRALAVAAAVQAGCGAANDALRTRLADALAGRLDWPDFTHGAAGQGFAALACARRLGARELATHADACAAYLVRTQGPQGAWTLPVGAPGASGECYTGFAHGAAGMMGFLGSYAALAGDAAADAAWRRAEAWLVSHARRGRAGGWQWPRSESRPAPDNWWCHGAPGIALGWLCVAKAQGTTAIAEEYLRGALGASPRKLRSDSLGQCHGLAGLGEIYLEAHRVLGEECWHERAADIARVLLALFRRRQQPPWHYLPEEPASGAEGLMLGTAGIVHFLLRFHHPEMVTSPPLLA